MLSRDVKAKKISALAETLSSGDALILAENAGLAAADMAALRDKARLCGGRAQVVKNTLARRALIDSPFRTALTELSGPLVYGVGSDAVALAKVFVEAAKENPKLIIRGGVLADKPLMSDENVTTLASLPGRERLLSQLAATMQIPVATLMRTLNEIPASFARALAALRDQRR